MAQRLVERFLDGFVHWDETLVTRHCLNDEVVSFEEEWLLLTGGLVKKDEVLDELLVVLRESLVCNA